MGPTRIAAVLLVLLVLAACAEEPAPGGRPADAAPPPRAQLPADPGALVLRVEHVGGFTTPQELAARLPVVSVYADGRAIFQGPVAAVHPGSAWPNIQVLELAPDRVRELAGRALAAGVAERGDLGSPPLADVPSTRFTLGTAEGTYVREVEALTDTAGMADSGLTGDQQAARQRLRELAADVADLAVSAPGEEVPRSWTPAAVAAVARPWTAPEEDVTRGLSPAPLPWPGPALPGEPIGPDVGCVVAGGETAGAVITAARDATVLTPWAMPDGSLWSVAFRPLLPDESGCADLLG